MLNSLPRVHDARLVGYTVDGELGQISLRLRPESKDDELFLLRFDGVFAYAFKHANLVSIIANVHEVTREMLISAEWESLKNGMNSNGWPEQLPRTQTEAVHFLQARELRSFIVGSSIGISGWLLAKNFGFTNDHGQLRSGGP
jgi:hypothetical protein